jgi:hypothetical protein
MKKIPNTSLAPIVPQGVPTFYRADSVARALDRAQFTVEEEIATLIRHFRDPDASVSLRAHARLRAVLRETAMASGLLAMQEIRGTQEADGRKLEVSLTASRIVSRIQEEIPDVTSEDRPSHASTYLPSGDSGDRGSLDSTPGSTSVDGPAGDGSSGRTDPV